MMTTEAIKAAVKDLVGGQLGPSFQRLDVTSDEEDLGESDVITITITVETNSPLKPGGVFNLPNTLRKELLARGETRFPVIYYNSASARTVVSVFHRSSGYCRYTSPEQWR